MRSLRVTFRHLGGRAKLTGPLHGRLSDRFSRDGWRRAALGSGYGSAMVSPRKRRNNSRSEKRASQRYTPPGTQSGGGNGNGGGGGEMIPRPPSSCSPHHFYWCDGHHDWHHHDEFVVTAIERTMQAAQPQDGPIIDGLDDL